MSVPFHMSHQSVSKFVFKTFEVIWDVLQPLELPTPNEEKWISIAKRFEDLWDFPFVIGSIDGKHIALKNPINSGSQYFNYKGFPSIVLMALSDADSCFTLIDCGQYGRISDSGVFEASKMSRMLENGDLRIPDTKFAVDGSDTELQHMIIGDEAFPLKPYLMKPYPARVLDRTRRIYNYRHSRARRAVECAFGILASKFEIFQRPMRIEPDKAILVTKTAAVLHNFIRRRDGHLIDRASEVTYETLGDNEQGLRSISHGSSQKRSTNKAIAIRDTLARYFCGDKGSVPWQNNLVFRNVNE